MLPLWVEVRIDPSGPIYYDKRMFERAMDDWEQRHAASASDITPREMWETNN